MNDETSKDPEDFWLGGTERGNSVFFGGSDFGQKASKHAPSQSLAQPGFQAAPSGSAVSAAHAC